MTPSCNLRKRDGKEGGWGSKERGSERGGREMGEKSEREKWAGGFWGEEWKEGFGKRESVEPRVRV